MSLATACSGAVVPVAGLCMDELRSGAAVPRGAVVSAPDATPDGRVHTLPSSGRSAFGGARRRRRVCCTRLVPNLDEPDAFRALGRFLWVGVLSGCVIGAAVALALVIPGPAEYWAAGATFGTAAGLIAGLLAQVVAFAVVLVGWRRTGKRAATARVFTLTPVPLAMVTAWTAASALQASRTQSLTAAGVAAVLALMAVGLTARRCTAPPVGHARRARA